MENIRVTLLTYDELSIEAKEKALKNLENDKAFIGYQNDVLQNDYDFVLRGEHSPLRQNLKNKYGITEFELGEGRNIDVWLKSMEVDATVFFRKSEQDSKLCRYLTEEFESLGNDMCGFLRDNRFAWHGYVDNMEQYDIDAAWALFQYLGLKDDNMKYTKQAQRIFKKMHKAPFEAEELINSYIQSIHNGVENKDFKVDYCEYNEIKFLATGELYKH